MCAICLAITCDGLEKLLNIESRSIVKNLPAHTIRKVKVLSKNSNLTKLYNFLGKSKLKFWTKNEDFEQCV